MNACIFTTSILASPPPPSVYSYSCIISATFTHFLTITSP